MAYQVRKATCGPSSYTPEAAGALRRPRLPRTFPLAHAAAQTTSLAQKSTKYTTLSSQVTTVDSTRSPTRRSLIRARLRVLKPQRHHVEARRLQRRRRQLTVPNHHHRLRLGVQVRRRRRLHGSAADLLNAAEVTEQVVLRAAVGNGGVGR